MARTFWLLLLSVLPLLGGRVEIVAQDVEQNGSNIMASGDVLVMHQNYSMSADRALYDQNRSILELFGNVTYFKDAQYVGHSRYMRFDLETKSDSAQPLFLAQQDEHLWMQAQRGWKEQDSVALADAILSSCERGCPDWKIGFSQADFNQTSAWLDVYDPVFYMYDKPLLYLPYLGFSTSRDRKSGLLRPTVGISAKEGLVYIQPVYIATDPQWDFEFDPQYRSNRGAGLFGTFRFVDSPVSNGFATVGAFRDQQSFQKRYDLINQSHYGAQLFYERRHLFALEEAGHQDGLHLDINYLNDPDFFNLQHTHNSELLATSQVYSRLNYAYATPEYYGGVYGRYYIDTSKVSNEETNQTLPILHLHKSATPLFGFEPLMLSADYRMTNYFSGKGEEALFHEFTVPVTLYLDLYENYLMASVSENFYYAYAGYSSRSEEAGSYYSFLRNYHRIDLFTDLAKMYDEHLHTLQLRASYSRPSFSNESGYLSETVSPRNTPTENLEFSLLQTLYDETGNEILFHRLSQLLDYEKSDHRFAALENEIEFRPLEKLQFYNALMYDYYARHISSSTSQVTFEEERYDIMLTHFLKDNEQEAKANTVTFEADFKVGSQYDIMLKSVYDFQNSLLQKWLLGYKFYKKCWDYVLTFAKERQPILTANGAESMDNYIFYVQINLVPIGGFNQKVEQSN